MKLPNYIALLAGALVMGGNLHSAVAADLSQTEERFVYCTVCHGSNLKGNEDTGAPRLSHLPEWYLLNQLNAFRHGWRGVHMQDEGGIEMRPMAEALSEDELKKVLAFVGSKASDIPKATFSADLAHGKQLFAACAACHGASAQGNQALNAPPLAGSSDWYLKRQLMHFKQGLRGDDGADMNGNTMRASAALLADEQAVDDVVAYIQSLN